MSPEVKRQRLIENSIRRNVKRSAAYWEFLASQPVKIVGPKGWKYYPCAICEQFFSRSKLDLDHIVPVVDPNCGFQDWNTYVERAYCESDGFQHVCRPCHRRKTKEEGVLRTKQRASKKQPRRKSPRDGDGSRQS